MMPPPKNLAEGIPMQVSNWLSLHKVSLVAVLMLLLVSFSTFALAQGQSASTVAMFAAAAKEQTNIAGVSIVTDRPNGFDPLTASAEELGKYGLPPRPDQQADPDSFARWTKGMQALKNRAAAHVKARPELSKPLMLAKQQPPASAMSGKPTQYYSYNWAGVANTNTLTSWNSEKSFDRVESIWNVAAARPPFHACANGILGAVDAPGFYEASWNGIDGFNNDDVLQGGSLSYADCQRNTEYLGWVEWYPSYSILEIECEADVACPVNPGDLFYVITYGSNAHTQYVFEEDVTQGWYGTFALEYVTGPALVGSSAEQIVERPCCDADGYPLALANYISDFFPAAAAFDGKGDIYLPGQQNSATAVIDMVNDAATEEISTVKQVGALSLFFESLNCAFSGGCVSF
jgi:Peptidase A4 family